MIGFDIVVAADREWGIGKANGLPWPRLRGDLAHFRRITSTVSAAGELAGARNAVVMGRKTWTSTEVAGKPLAKRLNVVVTRGPGELVVPDGVLVAASLGAAVEAAAGAERVERVFVVGGAHLFADALADARLACVYLTRVDGSYGCDVHIPNLDVRFVRDATWEGEAIGDENGTKYRIERLKRI